MELQKECAGVHRYFVADVCGVESEGKLFVVVVCTACGHTFCREFKVSNPNVRLTLRSEKEKEK